MLIAPSNHQKVIQHHSSRSSNTISTKSSPNDVRLPQQFHRRDLPANHSRVGKLPCANDCSSDGTMTMIPICLSDEMTLSSSGFRIDNNPNHNNDNDNDNRILTHHPSQQKVRPDRLGRQSATVALLDESLFSRDSINIGSTSHINTPKGRSPHPGPVVAMQAMLTTTPKANPVLSQDKNANPSFQRTPHSGGMNTSYNSSSRDKIGSSGNMSTKAKAGSYTLDSAHTHTSDPPLIYTDARTNNSDHHTSIINNNGDSNSTFKGFFSPALSSPEIVDLRDRMDQV